MSDTPREPGCKVVNVTDHSVELSWWWPTVHGKVTFQPVGQVTMGGRPWTNEFTREFGPTTAAPSTEKQLATAITAKAQAVATELTQLAGMISSQHAKALLKTIQGNVTTLLANTKQLQTLMNSAATGRANILE